MKPRIPFSIQTGLCPHSSSSSLAWGGEGRRNNRAKCDSPNALRLKNHRQVTHLTSSAQHLVSFVSGPDPSPDLKTPSFLPLDFPLPGFLLVYMSLSNKQTTFTEACCRLRAETLRGRKIVPVITHTPRGYQLGRNAQKSRLATPPPAGPSLPSFASSGPLC